MTITSAAGLLAAWEAGLGEPPLGRALLLHRTARPDVDSGSLPQLPVGEREADLFALRRALFGERMQVRLGCLACGEDMEFELDAGELARSLGGREEPSGGMVGSAGGRMGPAGGFAGSVGGRESLAGRPGRSPGGRDGSVAGFESSAEGPGGSVAGSAVSSGESGGSSGGRDGSADVLGGRQRWVDGPGGSSAERDEAAVAGVGGSSAGGLVGSSGGSAGSAGLPGGSPGGRDGVAPDGADRSVVRVRQGGWDVAFRLPGIADLTAAARAADPRGALLARCLVSAVHDGVAVDAADLPLPVQRRIAEAVEDADPGADLALNVACPECGQATRAELDIASYLWTELDAWARDVLLDVHLLATAYGWSEPEILALSPLRRRYYLELCADV